MNQTDMETQRPRPARKRKSLIVSALVGSALGLLLLGSAWKLGWFGESGKVTTQERVFDLGNGVKLTLCWCPPGTFLMGSPATETGRWKDEVQHEVILTQGFWMAKTETTQAQWEALMPDNPSWSKGEKLPVVGVTWKEAQDFAAALTERLRRQGKLEPGVEFRLPSESQWEYACRAGTVTAYFSGDGEAALVRAGWYYGNSDRKPSRMGEWLSSIPVFDLWFRGNSGGRSWPGGKKEENGFGLQDMHGNVWEWCEDVYAEYGEGKAVDPVGAREGPDRVVRGGCWLDSAAGCRSACRDSSASDQRRTQGFRVCLVPGPAAESLPQE